MSGALDIYTIAARKLVKLPDDWQPYLYVAVQGQGVMVTGKVVTDTISRGPRKGEPNFRKADTSTKQSVFVSHADYAAAKAEAL